MVKLAFWQTIGETYRLVWLRPRLMLQSAWIWIALSVAFYSSSFIFPHPVITPATGPAGLEPTQVAFFVVFGLVFNLLNCAAIITWMVSLSRAVLLHELSWRGPLRFGWRHWRFIGIGILIGLLTMLIVFGAMIGFALVGSAVVLIMRTLHIAVPRYIFLAVPAIMLPLDFFLIANFALAFPAISVDDPGGAISTAWRRGKRNRLRLCFGLALANLPYLIAFAAIAIAFFHAVDLRANGIETNPVNPIMSVGILVVTYSMYASGNVFYSLAYRQLAPNWTPPPALTATQVET